MNTKPVIGVIGCNKALEGEPAHTVKARYIQSLVAYAEAIPLIVPSVGNPEDLSAIVPKLDAILLTGGTANIEPDHYQSGEGHGPWDPARDVTSFALIRAAQAANVPIIGICRGLQEINVALGGSLIDWRDAETGMHAHHAPDDADLEGMFAHSHKIGVSPGSLLSEITGSDEILVNSVHYQMIGRLGSGLRVEATADDGCIEAISSRDGRSIFAVQWHPEWRAEERAHDLAFWAYVGALARASQELKLKLSTALAQSHSA